MVVLLGLAAAVLYGGGDFLGGMATRRAHVLTVLMLVETAAVIVSVAAALMSGGPAILSGLTWGFSAGAIGGLGLIIFYVGLAAGPMSVVAPVSGLVATVLPVAVALAEGERPGAGVYAGALLCLVAIVTGQLGERNRRPGRPRRSRPHRPHRPHRPRAPAAPPGPGHRLRHRVGYLVRPVLPAHPQRRTVRRSLAGGGRTDRRARRRAGRRGRAAARPAAASAAAFRWPRSARA